MTPEQAARMKAWSYASIGGGIACLVVAYQFAFTTPKEGVPSPTMGLIFTAIAVALLIAATVLAYKARKSGTPPATTDLSGPEGKKVIVLLVIGFGALACSWLTDYVIPKQDDILEASVSFALVLIAIVCLFSAARIGKRIRQASATGAAKK